eukprot:scaffold210985_cov32-Cyclotella_meneghiniana.AAC.1
MHQEEVTWNTENWVCLSTSNMGSLRILEDINIYPPSRGTLKCPSAVGSRRIWYVRPEGHLSVPLDGRFLRASTGARWSTVGTSA